MRQSRLMSLVKSRANVIIGCAVVALRQVLALPGLGPLATPEQSFGTGAVFMFVSLARSHALRRLFARTSCADESSGPN